ncbi:MAG: hypothetical protein V8K32_00060 [Candidatus Electrothrix gigas]
MEVSEHDLKEMNDAIKKRKTISQLAEIFPQYDYSEIYWAIDDYSFLGKKRMITNRLKKMRSATKKAEREELIDEAQELLDGMYDRLKINSKKLTDIDRVLRR